MIKLQQVSRIFQSHHIETTALNSVNLSVNQGEFVAIMGPSGCGKSTLLSILGLLDSPTSGQFWFAGQEISQQSETQLSALRKSYLGFIFQSFNLINELTVFENIALPLQYQKINKADRQLRVEAMLERIGLNHRADHFPQQLSGGQQQRVAIARALVINPKLILADEPTGNLDSHNGAQVMDLLKALNDEGTTIIMVTHSEHDANYASRIIHLLDGHIIQDRGMMTMPEVIYAG